MAHKNRQDRPARPGRDRGPRVTSEKPALQIVVKSDTVGTLAAARESLEAIQAGGAQLDVIQDGIGPVTKSDVEMAATGSRLVIGFGVGILPRVEEIAKTESVEVRLYDVIYHLTRDVAQIVESWLRKPPEERVTGRAKVIALFKSTRKGIILGCEVLEGTLALGRRFRVTSAMGPVYQGTVESLHIEQDTVKEGRVGQQVGLKIRDFKAAKIGDRVECFEETRPDSGKPWAPKGGIQRIHS